MKEEIKINFNPNSKDLKYIEQQLFKGKNKGEPGFHNNWEIIEDAFYKKKFISLNLGDKIIGFLTYNIYYNKIVNICCMEIFSDYRKRGYGNLCFKKIEDLFRERNIFVLTIEDPLPEANEFWGKLNFKIFNNDYNNISFYKIISRKLEPNNIDDYKGNYILEVGEKDDFYFTGKKPTKRFILEFKNDGKNLKKPIILFFKKDWWIRLVIDGGVVLEDKAKYFLGGQYLKNNFFIIEKIDWGKVKKIQSGNH